MRRYLRNTTDCDHCSEPTENPVLVAVREHASAHSGSTHYCLPCARGYLAAAPLPRRERLHVEEAVREAEAQHASQATPRPQLRLVRGPEGKA
ncbi:hypothetical protein [Streptomyces sp. NPDC005438]|uniref:hypothetical protein n=1 Tax=Streptomyces sp. NPDC005438 TaxID=3156880 RepID=UPI0033AD7399